MTDYTLLHYCLELETEELFAYIERFLQSVGYTVHVGRDKNDTLYLACIPEKPTTKIALVAHCDTIIRKDGVSLYYDGGIMHNANGVLGADDRAGVYGLLHTVAYTNHRPLMFFTNFEETGGRGVKALCDDKRLHDWLIEHDVRLFIELDRANNNEYVYYSWELPREVHNFAQDYGFREAVGSYSDVADLTDATTIPHLNLSIGYKNQHGKAEQLSIPDMMRTVAALDMMLYREPAKVYISSRPVRSHVLYDSWDWGQWHSKKSRNTKSVAFVNPPSDEEIIAECDYAGANLLNVLDLMQSGWTLQEAINTDLADNPDEFLVRGSCFVCMSKQKLHNTLLVCEECYARSMERR